jgi:hypothetical protein
VPVPHELKTPPLILGPPQPERRQLSSLRLQKQQLQRLLVHPRERPLSCTPPKLNTQTACWLGYRCPCAHTISSLLISLWLRNYLLLPTLLATSQSAPVQGTSIFIAPSVLNIWILGSWKQLPSLWRGWKNILIIYKTEKVLNQHAEAWNNI